MAQERPYLNTPTVKVKPFISKRFPWVFPNLNTPTVKVKQEVKVMEKAMKEYLNTPTVKVKPTKIKLFKNIILLKCLFFNEIFNFFPTNI